MLVSKVLVHLVDAQKSIIVLFGLSRLVEYLENVDKSIYGRIRNIIVNK